MVFKLTIEIRKTKCMNKVIELWNGVLNLGSPEYKLKTSFT